MEENSSLFSLSIDAQTKDHLSETAKWARLLAIVGFVFLFIILAYSIYSFVAMSGNVDSMAGRRVNTTLTAASGIAYFFVFVLYFFPLIFTLRFANKMKLALNANDQQELNSAFQNLKILFRYIGIITIISVVLMALSFLMVIIA